MIRTCTALCLLPLSAYADVPKVMTDIAPIHSLTAQVMGDLGTPDLLLPPTADPHDFSLRPSDASRLSNADVVIWVGNGLTPWLTEPLNTLAPDATTLSLLETEGWEKLAPRDPDELNAHVDVEEHDEHDEHDEHAHHDHGDVDPHAWLNPTISAQWVAIIAQELSAADPENAATYASNADTTIAHLMMLDEEITTQLASVQNTGYLLPHDGYHYFELHYGLQATGMVAGIDARAPGPARVAALRDLVADGAVHCVFDDNEINPRITATVAEGSDAQMLTLDATGAGLDAGPDLYDALLRGMATSFVDCLS